MAESPHFAWPQETRETVHLGKTLIADDFSIAAPTGANAVRAIVIKALTVELPVKSHLESGLQNPSAPPVPLLVQRGLGPAAVAVARVLLRLGPIAEAGLHPANRCY